MTGQHGIARATLLERIRDYYDGFCFDGKTRLYSPISMLQFLKKAEFANYWYTSGSPSFIVSYMRQHAIRVPEQYRHIQVAVDFADSQEIEYAQPESFLYQGGYLTIARKEERELTLDYPYREALDSLSRMYLEHAYHVDGFRLELLGVEGAFGG